MYSALPNEYSIKVESWEDVQSVIDSGFIDCACFKNGNLGYEFPAELYIDHGVMIGWDDHATNSFTLNQWKQTIENQED